MGSTSTAIGAPAGSGAPVKSRTALGRAAKSRAPERRSSRLERTTKANYILWITGEPCIACLAVSLEEGIPSHIEGRPDFTLKLSRPCVGRRPSRLPFSHACRRHGDRSSAGVAGNFSPAPGHCSLKRVARPGDFRQSWKVVFHPRDVKTHPRAVKLYPRAVTIDPRA